MRIGVLSDTPDNLPLIDRAVRFFNREKTDFVFHAGDFVAPFTVAHLSKLGCEWKGVFGNNDGEKKGLREKSGGRIGRGPLKMRCGGRTVAVVHDRAALAKKKIRADLIIFGHNHVPSIEKTGKTLFVNPGECSGWLSGTSTVALVDLAAMEAGIHVL